MISMIPITIIKDRIGRIVFQFADGPQSFITLAVVTDEGETLWEVHPGSIQPGNDGSGTFVSIRLSQPLGAVFQRISGLSDSGVMDQFPAVDDVTYGSSPVGYYSLGPAGTLEPDRIYTVIVLRDTAYGIADFRI